MLAAVDHTKRPVLEIISDDADRDILDGANKYRCGCSAAPDNY